MVMSGIVNVYDDIQCQTFLFLVLGGNFSLTFFSWDKNEGNALRLGEEAGAEVINWGT